MRGEIGTLTQNGRQVGGFLDWNIETLFEKSRGLPIPKTLASARSFWMFEDCNEDEFKAVFYVRLDGKLEVAQEVNVAVRFPGHYLLDKHIKAELEMELELQ